MEKEDFKLRVLDQAKIILKIHHDQFGVNAADPGHLLLKTILVHKAASRMMLTIGLDKSDGSMEISVALSLLQSTRLMSDTFYLLEIYQGQIAKDQHISTRNITIPHFRDYMLRANFEMDNGVLLYLNSHKHQTTRLHRNPRIADQLALGYLQRAIGCRAPVPGPWDYPQMTVADILQKANEDEIKLLSLVGIGLKGWR